MTMKKVSSIIFILIILTPMTGCIEDEPSAQPSEENQQPVIYGTIHLEHFFDNTTNLTHDYSLWIAAMALDYDGVIEQFGIDVDSDGVIDYNASNSSTYHHQLITNENEWMNPVPWSKFNNNNIDFCQQWISIIAIDDKGDRDVQPFSIEFVWDDQVQMCLEPIRNLEMYSFSGADAPAATGVLVTMSQGGDADFASLDIKVSINGGQGANCDATCYTEAGTADQAWTTGEDLAIAADCGQDAAGADIDQCTVTVTVFDNRANQQIGNDVSVAMDETA